MVTEFSKEISVLQKRLTRHQDHKSFAFYGSSSIRLWESLEEDFAPRNVINLGFGGSSYGWMAHYYEALFAGRKHDHVILYSGDNDHHKGHLSERILRNFRRLTHEIWHDSPRTSIHVISVKPSPHRENQMTKIEETNNLLKQSITSNKHGHWVDIYDAMLNTQGRPRPELFVEDMLHMNARGYEIWKCALQEHFDKLSI